MSDDGKHGFSIIAMIGSVFSPYYAWSGRHKPQNHIGLNVGLYGGGNKRWTLTERGSGELVQERHFLKMGPSEITWDGNCLVVTIDEWANPVFRRVRGEIRIYPECLISEPLTLDTHGRHFWQPFGAISRVEVAFEKPSLNWSGKAYMDSNWGSEPLEQGFSYWDWSRAHTANGAHVYYDAFTRTGENRQLSLAIGRDGSVTEKDIPARSELGRGPIWRVRRSTLAEPGVKPETLAMLEDTPFYTRSHLATSIAGEDVIAVHESLDLDRFSQNWVRGLLPFRMPRRKGRA
ncbi:MAG: carotenoid 1,2-hydratase [Pseudomonadota bacterium]